LRAKLRLNNEAGIQGYTSDDSGRRFGVGARTDSCEHRELRHRAAIGSVSRFGDSVLQELLSLCEDPLQPLGDGAVVLVAEDLGGFAELRDAGAEQHDDLTVAWAEDGQEVAVDHVVQDLGLWTLDPGR
jgi:hypothetical protein